MSTASVLGGGGFVTIEEAISLPARKALEAVAAVEANGMDVRDPEGMPILALLGEVGDALEHVANHLMDEARAATEGREISAEEAECSTLALRKLALLATLLWASSAQSAAAPSEIPTMN